MQISLVPQIIFPRKNYLRHSRIVLLLRVLCRTARLQRGEISPERKCHEEEYFRRSRFRSFRAGLGGGQHRPGGAGSSAHGRQGSRPLGFGERRKGRRWYSGEQDQGKKISS